MALRTVCYLSAPERLATGLPQKTEFGRTQYDSLVEVVDPKKVYEAITRLYGHKLDRPRDEVSGESPNKTIASQFVRIHHQVKSERNKADKTAPQSEPGIVRLDTR